MKKMTLRNAVETLGKDEEIAQLREEVERLKLTLLHAEMDRDVALAKLEGVWPNARIEELQEEVATLREIADAAETYFNRQADYEGVQHTLPTSELLPYMHRRNEACAALDAALRKAGR